MYRLAVTGLAALMACAASLSPASAGEGPFGWIYTLDLQPKNTWQFQQWEWLQEGQAGGTYHFLTSRSELEYGVTDWYQAGLYLNGSLVKAHKNGVDGTTGGPGTDIPPGFGPTMPYNKTRFESFSMEHVFKILNPYKDPIGFGLYFEPTIGPRTKELEMKLLFQKNFLDDRLGQPQTW